VHQLKVLERYAYNAIRYALGFNETKIAIRVRELGYVEVVDKYLKIFETLCVFRRRRPHVSARCISLPLTVQWDWKRGPAI